ncbi:hypothetical protein F383_23672 [Gossypium arboreum]|uniref:Uncharacterized protein n=1 Tax=Gossypium arboreum TaxID=29729 RepID=A0A0B0NXK7_GOSAR|nr:hypothetical protein F383_23672 [Gossypium arboreum]
MAMRKWLEKGSMNLDLLWVVCIYIWGHDVAMVWKWECWSYDQPLAWLK